MIESFFKNIPIELFQRSGKVFYSGRKVFLAPSSLYVLGVNPGGAPKNHQNETVGNHSLAVLNDYPDDWSAYRDERWEGFEPGTYGMAPRVLHLFARLELNPGSVPCSNLVFVRSQRENDIAQEMAALADLCWPFHQCVIEQHRPQVVLCFGKTTGNYVRRKLNANILISEFVETNRRKCRSQAFVNKEGVNVVIATHPSIANWCKVDADPTDLVLDLLQQAQPEGYSRETD